MRWNSRRPPTRERIYERWRKRLPPDSEFAGLTDIELEAFLTTLVEFSKMPYIGGKSAAGLGEVSVQFDKWIEIDSRVSPQGRDVSFVLGTQYAEHLKKRGGDIREALRTIQ